jgi:hydrogenase/urease accessory protein HupE
MLALVLAATLPAIACGHEVRPGYLELRQTGAESWSVLWKVPAQGDMRLSIHPRFPESCGLAGEPVAVQAGGAYTERTSIACKDGLAGRAIGIDGLSATMTDVLVRMEGLDGTRQITRLTPSTPTFVVEAAPSVLGVARTYLVLGVEHILLGIDHLLFVLALLILVKGTRRLIWTVTAFTLAHSLTLAGATLGFVHVPGPPVEAAIALSIVFVAAEIVHSRQGMKGLTERFPWIVAFTFGLLHGFGFASALSEVGLPQTAIPVALLCFNVGVEIGQLLFIAFVFAVIATARRVMRRLAVSQPAWTWRVPPYAIGSVAAFWAVQRIVAF